MNITINQKDYKHFLQCIYLGNLVINGNKEFGEELTEHDEFVEGIYLQFIENMPERKSHFEFQKIKLENSIERKVADFSDLLSDSVEEYYKDFQNSFLNDLLANKMADTKYPISNYDEEMILKNLSAKNYYYQILQNFEDKIIKIEIPTELKNKKPGIVIKPINSEKRRLS